MAHDVVDEAVFGQNRVTWFSQESWITLPATQSADSRVIRPTQVGFPLPAGLPGGPDERRRQRGHGLADRLRAGPGGDDPDDGLV